MSNIINKSIPSIYVYILKLFFQVHDNVLLGSCPEIPCWKRYSQKIYAYITANLNVNSS